MKHTFGDSLAAVGVTCVVEVSFVPLLLIRGDLAVVILSIRCASVHVRALRDPSWELIRGQCCSYRHSGCREVVVASTRLNAISHVWENVLSPALEEVMNMVVEVEDVDSKKKVRD